MSEMLDIVLKSFSFEKVAVWNVITFALLVFVLGKFGWKPIIHSLDARMAKIKGDIDLAKRNRQESDQILAEQKKLLSDARSDAGEIVSKAKTDGNAMKDEIIEKARKEAQGIVQKAVDEAESAKSRVMDDLKNEMGLLSLQIAGQVIGKTLSPKDHKDLVIEALSQYKSQN